MKKHREKMKMRCHSFHVCSCFYYNYAAIHHIQLKKSSDGIFLRIPFLLLLFLSRNIKDVYNKDKKSNVFQYLYFKNIKFTLKYTRLSFFNQTCFHV